MQWAEVMVDQFSEDKGLKQEDFEVSFSRLVWAQ